MNTACYQLLFLYSYLIDTFISSASFQKNKLFIIIYLVGFSFSFVELETIIVVGQELKAKLRE